MEIYGSSPTMLWLSEFKGTLLDIRKVSNRSGAVHIYSGTQTWIYQRWVVDIGLSPHSIRVSVLRWRGGNCRPLKDQGVCGEKSLMRISRDSTIQHGRTYSSNTSFSYLWICWILNNIKPSWRYFSWWRSWLAAMTFSKLSLERGQKHTTIVAKLHIHIYPPLPIPLGQFQLWIDNLSD